MPEAKSYKDKRTLKLRILGILSQDQAATVFLAELWPGLQDGNKGSVMEHTAYLLARKQDDTPPIIQEPPIWLLPLKVP